jgi:multimeric flavodoxin WrbA
MEEIIRGAKDGGADVTVVTPEGIKRCECCGDGWGTCLKEHICSITDDRFEEAQAAVRAADAVCIITPVYWQEVSEGLKSLMDRLRRRENPFYEPDGALAGKPVLMVAIPGGSGHGMLPCLEQMHRFCQHTKAEVFDFIGVNRWNADYKKTAACAAARAMASGRKIGDNA